jgi:hypothetical protein
MKLRLGWKGEYLAAVVSGGSIALLFTIQGANR